MLLFRLHAVCLLLLVPGVLCCAQQVDAAPSDPLSAVRKLIDSGHAADALTRIDALTAESGSTPQRLSSLQTLRGQALYTEGKLPEASRTFAAALAANPANREAGQMSGMTLFRLGRPADAIPFLERSGREAVQNRADPSYVLALCYMDARRYDDARHAFATLYEFKPDSAEAYLITARMLLRRDFLPVSEQFATKASALNPQLPLAHELLGEIALAGNHLEDAEREFEAERQRNPLEGGLYDRLGDTYLRAGEYDKAERSLRKAIVLEPNATGPYILLGKALLKQGDAAGALLYLERAKSMDPGNYMTRSLLGQGYRAVGRGAEASAETRAAVQIQAASEPKIIAPATAESTPAKPR